MALRGHRSRALGIKVATSEEFLKALHVSDEYDGVVLIQCEIDKEDCTKELRQFGRLVAANSKRV